MQIWLNIVLAVQLLSALVMIGLVLIQHGKGADMGASFGSGASGSLFGATGIANFLSRSTAVLRDACSSSARWRWRICRTRGATRDATAAACSTAVRGRRVGAARFGGCSARSAARRVHPAAATPAAPAPAPPRLRRRRDLPQ